MTNDIENNPVTNQEVEMELMVLDRIKYMIQGEMVWHQPDAVITKSILVPTSVLD